MTNIPWMMRSLADSRRVSIGVTAFVLGFGIAGWSAPRIQPVAPKTTRAPGPPADVERILWWFPEDTETIVVSRGPFAIPGPPTGATMPSLGAFLRMWSARPFSLRGGKYADHVIGRSIALSVEGNKHFRLPHGEGLGDYEGCEVVVIGKDFGDAADSFMVAVAADASGKTKVGDVDVLEFEEQTQIAGADQLKPGVKAEGRRFVVFIARPEPTVLLVATDRGVIEDVLTRMSRRGSKRALPDDLPEWKQIDTDATFWALRHYDAAAAKDDPTSPLGNGHLQVEADPKAKGLVFFFNEPDGKPTVRYLSSNANAEAIAAKNWSHPAPGHKENLEPSIEAIAPDVVEITVRSGKPEDTGIFILVWMCAIGHVLCGM
ncbi:MAG: hypothetical protein HY292_09710 [Planctomycetes bacterium]|nr:hypothetical protein [Planctomycetota bacterium]